MSHGSRPYGWLILLALLMVGPACVYASEAGGPPSDHPGTGIGTTPALALDHTDGLDDIITSLARQRVVYVGEIHSRYDNHLIQLHIIKALAARDGPLAIGVEWFQQPFQQALDRYLAGDIDERQLLQQSEYFSRWRYDFRLYAPILRYARAHHIPMIALNVPTELTQAVSAHGLDGLTPELRRWVPHTLDRTNARYQARLREIYQAHPHTRFGDFERFYTVQLLWDEGMAQRASEYLTAHPDTRLIVLAGSGHLAYGDGIPDRLQRQSGIDGAIVLSQWQGEMSTGLADYLLLPEPVSLPPAGMLGVTIEPAAQGIRLREVSAGSAAARAGLRQGDRLVAIDGTPIATLADVRAVMWAKQPDEQVAVTVRHGPDPDSAKPETLQVTLQ